ncbi:uncharacterized protein EV420DRAFT_1533223, partial [Desarmillaria tabescens]
MDTPCPTNIRDFLSFLPARPSLHPDARYSTSTEAYYAGDVAPPQECPICCRPYPELLPKLKNFLHELVDSLGIGGVSCQSMQQDLERMSLKSFLTETDVSLYGANAIAAIQPIVRAITEASGIPGRINVLYEPARGGIVDSQRGDFNITVERKWLEDGHVRRQRILVCSDEDKAYSVLLSKAEALSRPFRLDATKEQTGAKAMAVKLALQMTTVGADYGFFFGGFIAIAAQLVRSVDPSHPGTILLLSPVFKLQNETLPDPYPSKPLTPFQANIPTEPFFAIIVAMLCVNMLPEYSIEGPPRDLSLPLTIPDAGEEDDARGVGDDEENIIVSGETGIPTFDLQVATNAMILHHPWLSCSDIHRISVTGLQNIPAANNSIALTKYISLSPLQPRCLLRAPHIPSTNIDVVTLIERISASRWSIVWRCRVQGGDDKSRIMKLVARVHSAMILRELYMYEVALKDSCYLIPACYGVFQRPAGGWFGFLLEDVGDSLEEVYGMDWSDVKRGMSATEWQKFIDSVMELHSLGVIHGDLEPRNVARTADGFKFFDFGRSKLHRCQRDECGELQDLLEI